MASDRGTATSRAAEARARGRGDEKPVRPGDEPTHGGDKRTLGTYDNKVKMKKPEGETVIAHGKASTAVANSNAGAKPKSY
jgi:hypothetical protein